MAQWNTDEELFALMREELATCPVSDVLEQLGFATPMLPPAIRPLHAEMVLIGRAMPVQDDPPVPHGGLRRYDAKPFGLLFESIEALRPGEVYIASGGPVGAARMGDLLAARVRKIGAAGVVLNAHVRDANAIAELACRCSRTAPMPTGCRGATTWWISAARSASARCGCAPATSCSATTTACA